MRTFGDIGRLIDRIVVFAQLMQKIATSQQLISIDFRQNIFLAIVVNQWTYAETNLLPKRLEIDEIYRIESSFGRNHYAGRFDSCAALIGARVLIRSCRLSNTFIDTNQIVDLCFAHFDPIRMRIEILQGVQQLAEQCTSSCQVTVQVHRIVDN
jgi:hypothetical protein